MNPIQQVFDVCIEPRGKFLECNECVGMKMSHTCKRLPFKKDEALLMFVVDVVDEINGVAGFNVRPRENISFKGAGVRAGSLRPSPVLSSPVTRWKHQSDLELANTDYRIL